MSQELTDTFQVHAPGFGHRDSQGIACRISAVCARRRDHDVADENIGLGRGLGFLGETLEGQNHRQAGVAAKLLQMRLAHALRSRSPCFFSQLSESVLGQIALPRQAAGFRIGDAPLVHLRGQSFGRFLRGPFAATVDSEPIKRPIGPVVSVVDGVEFRAQLSPAVGAAVDGRLFVDELGSQIAQPQKVACLLDPRLGHRQFGPLAIDAGRLENVAIGIKANVAGSDPVCVQRGRCAKTGSEGMDRVDGPRPRIVAVASGDRLIDHICQCRAHLVG